MMPDFIIWDLVSCQPSEVSGGEGNASSNKTWRKRIKQDNANNMKYFIWIIISFFFLIMPPDQ